MPEHTKGPWRQVTACSSDFTSIRYIEATDNCVTVCRVNSGARANRTYPPEFEQAEALANARLIAAAPDLLEALKYVAQSDEIMILLQRIVDNNGNHICGNIRAAIAKATGQ